MSCILLCIKYPFGGSCGSAGGTGNDPGYFGLGGEKKGSRVPGQHFRGCKGQRFQLAEGIQVIREFFIMALPFF